MRAFLPSNFQLVLAKWSPFLRFISSVSLTRLSIKVHFLDSFKFYIPSFVFVSISKSTFPSQETARQASSPSNNFQVQLASGRFLKLS